MLLKLIFNPFEKIAGYTALVVGLAIILLTSFLAALNGIHFDGVLSVQLGAYTGFHVPFAESLINYTFLCLTGYIVCRIFSKSNFRIIDLSGTIAFSRYPLLIATAMGFIPGIDRQNPYNMINFLVGFAVIFCVVWSQILLYNSLHISANLKGNKKWIAYIILITFTAVISSLFYNKIYLLIL